MSHPYALGCKCLAASNIALLAVLHDIVVQLLQQTTHAATYVTNYVIVMLFYICRYSAETASGKAEVKDHLLDDATDDLWGQLRHEHIAGVRLIARLQQDRGSGVLCSGWQDCGAVGVADGLPSRNVAVGAM
jgi:hypothetical protein